MDVGIILIIVCIIYVVIQFSKIKEYDNSKSTLMLQYTQEYERLVEEYHTALNKCLVSPVKDKIELDDRAYYYSSDLYCCTSVYNLENNHLLFVKETPPYKYDFNDDACRSHPSSAGSVEVLADLYIPDILFWTEKGDVQYTTTMSGGGSNLDGAIAGAIIGGAAGAIIGSREQITSKVNTIDSRVISVRMNSGKEEELPFLYEKALKAFIPEKEYSFIQIKSSLGAN